MEIAKLSPEFDDWAGLLGLIGRAYAPMDGVIDPPSSRHQLTPRLLEERAGREQVFVAQDKGRIVGCVFLDDRGDHFYLGKLAVEPELHGRGIARAMFATAEAHAIEQGKPIIELQVRIELSGNQALFGRFGYREICRTSHPGYTRVTSITLRKQLENADLI